VKEQRRHNTGLAKVAVQWLNHPESFWDCASIKVSVWLTVKCFENTKFGQLKTLAKILHRSINQILLK